MISDGHGAKVIIHPPLTHLFIRKGYNYYTHKSSMVKNVCCAYLCMPTNYAAC